MIVSKRIGRTAEDVIMNCPQDGDSATCEGTECSDYQECWKAMNPTEDGYISFNVEYNAFPGRRGT